MLRRPISWVIIVTFVVSLIGPYKPAQADTPLSLPAPGTMINLSPAYQPVIIKGLTVHKDNPFLFDFIVDVGQDKMSGEPLKQEGEKLIKYFLASLAIPDKDAWVNLSPYEKDRMVPEALGQTDMGRDLLEQDYILKQITASLIYPEKQLGRTFWNEVYAKAQAEYGTTQIPVNTFNKVWIMADRAEVFEHGQTAFVVGSHLKVMLEEDYLALQKHENSVILSEGPHAGHAQVASKDLNKINSIRDSSPPQADQNDMHRLSSQIVRKIILPELEHEVNTGKNFANLRQIFNSIILASWYKRNLKEALLNQVYANRSKVNGIQRPGVIASEAKQSQQALSPEQIYQMYLKAYKKGVFNYIKEDMINGKTLPRKYFSGGLEASVDNLAMTTNPAVLANSLPTDSGRLEIFDTGFNTNQPPAFPSAAMMAREQSLQEATVLKQKYRGKVTVPELITSQRLLDGVLADSKGRFTQEDVMTLNNRYTRGWLVFPLEPHTAELHDADDAMLNVSIKVYQLGDRLPDNQEAVDEQSRKYPMSLQWNSSGLSVFVYIAKMIANPNWFMGVDYAYKNKRKIVLRRKIALGTTLPSESELAETVESASRRINANNFKKLSPSDEIGAVMNALKAELEARSKMSDDEQLASWVEPFVIEVLSRIKILSKPPRQRGGIYKYKITLGESVREILENPSAAMTSEAERVAIATLNEFFEEEGEDYRFDITLDSDKNPLEEVLMADEKVLGGRVILHPIIISTVVALSLGLSSDKEKKMERLLFDAFKENGIPMPYLPPEISAHIKDFYKLAKLESQEGNPNNAMTSVDASAAMRTGLMDNERMAIYKCIFDYLGNNDVMRIKERAALLQLAVMLKKANTWTKVIEAVDLNSNQISPHKLRDSLLNEIGLTKMPLSLDTQASLKELFIKARQETKIESIQTALDIRIPLLDQIKSAGDLIGFFSQLNGNKGLVQALKNADGVIEEDSSRHETIREFALPSAAMSTKKKKPRRVWVTLDDGSKVSGFIENWNGGIATVGIHKGEVIRVPLWRVRDAAMRISTTEEIKQFMAEHLTGAVAAIHLEDRFSSLGDRDTMAFLVNLMDQFFQVTLPLNSRLIRSGTVGEVIHYIQAEESDTAMMTRVNKALLHASAVKGGIDLNTSNGMQWKVSKDGHGVEMNINPAMIAQIKAHGIDSLSPVIFSITPVRSIWPLIGMQAPATGTA